MRNLSRIAGVTLSMLSGLFFTLTDAGAVMEAGKMPFSGTVGEVIRRDDNKLQLIWQEMPKYGKIKLLWLDVTGGKKTPITGKISQGKLILNDPNPGRRTLFFVPQSEGTGSLIIGERKVPAGGMDNLRDLGGYITADGGYIKWGYFYRGDTLHKVTKEGYAYVDTMRLKYVDDLRNSSEIAKKPDPDFANVVWQHTLIPDLSPKYKDVSWDSNDAIYKFVKTPRAEEFYSDINRFMISQPETLKTLNVIFTQALKNEGALLWHCAGGKDRTGLVSALILAAAGVSDKNIIDDYMLTNVYRQDFDRHELMEMSKVFNGDKMAIKGFLAIQQARPEYIQSALSEIRYHYGSLERYLIDAVKISPESLGEFKKRYVEYKLRGSDKSYSS